MASKGGGVEPVELLKPYFSILLSLSVYLYVYLYIYNIYISIYI